MARPRPAWRLSPLVAIAALIVAATVGARPVAACSGAPAVLAPDLEAHVGRIVVAKVVERTGRSPGPRGITLAVQETLRGAGPDLLTLERPRQAAGVCHDVFTVWRNARVLIAFDVRPLAGGGPLMPAWLVRKDGTLDGIYDDPPYETVDAARTALAATAPRGVSRIEEPGSATVALTLLAGVGVLAAAAFAGARARRPSPRVERATAMR